MDVYAVQYRAENKQSITERYKGSGERSNVCLAKTSTRESRRKVMARSRQTEMQTDQRKERETGQRRGGEGEKGEDRQ
eukprot:768530-Hanusia_phi.AAC.3